MQKSSLTCVSNYWTEATSPEPPFPFHTKEFGEKIEEQKTFVFKASLDSVNARSGAYYSTQLLGLIWNNALTCTCRPSSPKSISVQAHVRMLGVVGRRKPEPGRRANGSLRCADGVSGLWRLDVREQYGSAFPYLHENERSCATYVLRKSGRIVIFNSISQLPA